MGAPALRAHPLDLLTQRQSRCERRRAAFTQRIIPVWNSLGSARDVETVNAFKNQLDKLWASQDSLTNPDTALPSGVRVRGVFTV